MNHRISNKFYLPGACLSLLLLLVGSPAIGSSGSGGGMTMEEAIASGNCEDGDLPCLEEMMAASEDQGSKDGKSKDDKSDDRSKDDKSKDSKSDDGSSDDKSSKDDDSKSDDGSSDDKSSKDDDSKSDDGSSDDKSSKDDDSKSDDGSSDDKSSKDDDSKSDDGSSDDKSSKDDDSKSDDGSSDDKSSKDDDSSSDDDSSCDDSSSKDDDSSSDDDSSCDGEPEVSAILSINDNETSEVFHPQMLPNPVTLRISIDVAVAQPVSVGWETVDGSAMAGSDYIGAQGVAVIPQGEISVAITLLILDDDIAEPPIGEPRATESFFVDLSMPVGAKIGDGRGEIVISDNDEIDD